jgi:hypothetical protein
MPRLALIQFLDGGDGPVDPGFGMPGYGGRPDNELPRPPGSIGTLPVFPFDPTKPDNSLPGNPVPTPPIQLHPGLKLVVRYMACHGFIAVPDNELPDTPEPK